MVPPYLDECLSRRSVARQRRAAGHSLYVATELGLKGETDHVQLENATRVGAVLASQNQGDFTRLHERWQAEGRRHTGILLTRQNLPLRVQIERLATAARLLTPEIARD